MPHKKHARVLSAISGLRRPEAFALWFYRIVINESKRRRTRMAREIGPVQPPATCNSNPMIEDQMDVRRAVASLDPNLRTAVVLHYFFDLTTAEIASAVQTSPVTVRWRLMVARRLLRPLLDVPSRLATASRP